MQRRVLALALVLAAGCDASSIVVDAGVDTPVGMRCELPSCIGACVVPCLPDHSGLGRPVPCPTGAACAGGYCVYPDFDAGTLDAGTLDAGPRGDAGCSRGPLGGIGIPASTVASDNATTASTADLAIDGDSATAWTAPTPRSWLQLDFPAPITITGVRFSGGSTPEANVQYWVEETGCAPTVGMATLAESTPVPLPAIPITPYAYRHLHLEIDGAAALATIAELTLLTTECP